MRVLLEVLGIGARLRVWQVLECAMSVSAFAFLSQRQFYANWLVFDAAANRRLLRNSLPNRIGRRHYTPHPSRQGTDASCPPLKRRHASEGQPMDSRLSRWTSITRREMVV